MGTEGKFTVEGSGEEVPTVVKHFSLVIPFSPLLRVLLVFVTHGFITKTRDSERLNNLFLGHAVNKWPSQVWEPGLSGSLSTHIKTSSDESDHFWHIPYPGFFSCPPLTRSQEKGYHSLYLIRPEKDTLSALINSTES